MRAQGRRIGPEEKVSAQMMCRWSACGLCIDLSTLLIGVRRFAIKTPLSFVSSSTSQSSLVTRILRTSMVYRRLVSALRCIMVYNTYL